MRCLLIEDGNRLILIDCGIGDKQDAKFLSHYHLHGDASLENSIRKAGFHSNDITDVFLTHLHFDHCGGAIHRNNDKLIPTFKNANYWSNERHWKWATQPNQREKASFLKENILPIEESGQLEFIAENEQFHQSIEIFFANGHTEQQMIPIIQYKDKKIAYMADLLPSTGHIPLPYVMGYDTRPLLTMEEKERFLNQAADENYILFLEHDAQNECCTLQHTEKGIRLKETFLLKEIA
jgi:glyoxylase-like metal-dependent hydrolase (beta-lactamase superfamily II)